MHRAAGPACLAAALVWSALCWRPPAVLGAGPLDEQTAQEIRDYVSSELERLAVPGAAVVVVQDDQIVFGEGFGIAQPDGTPATAQTPFRLASVSKSITALAVMQQVEAGNLELDALVRDYLPWFGADGSDTARITVRDLLGQTSGWSTPDGRAELADDATDDAALERNVRRLAEVPLSHPIGQFEYSNANYNALGLLVATVSGQSFEDYVRDQVFDPLEMHHSFADQLGAADDGLATGYYPVFGVPIPFELGFVRAEVPAGFIAASAEDLGHMLIAHLNGGRYGDAKVLSEAGVRSLHEPLSHPDGPWDGYAMGLWVYPFFDVGALTAGPDGVQAYDVPVVLEHGGDHANFATGIIMAPEDGWGVAVLMNLNDEAAASRYHKLHTGIMALLLGGEALPATADEDFLGQNFKAILAGIVVLQLIGVAWALRRLRHWRQRPETAPHTRLAIARHLVLPLVVDLGVPIAIWTIISERGGAPFDVVMRWAPDIAMGVIVIALLGVGWGILRTILTVRLMRGSGPKETAPAADPMPSPG